MFAPNPHGWIQIGILTFIFLIFFNRSSRPKNVIYLFFFFFSQFTVGLYWLFISLHSYGDMPAPLSAIAVAMFTAALSIFPVGVIHIGKRLYPNLNLSAYSFSEKILSLFIIASLWSLADWLRGTLFTGFPWLATGYGQIDGPFQYFAPWFGVYGIGWITAFFAACLALFCKTFLLLIVRRSRSIPAFILTSNPNSSFNATLEKTLSFKQLIIHLIIILCIIYSVLSLSVLAGKKQFTQPFGQPLNLRLLQGNIDQNLKFAEYNLPQTINLYQKLITKKAADLIITPETAYPILFNQISNQNIKQLYDFSRATQSAILLGTFSVNENFTYNQDNELNISNSVIGFNANYPAYYRYNKIHLVPFGEYNPPGFSWLISQLNIPLNQLEPGSYKQTHFFVKQQAAAINICYEDIFGEEIAQSLRVQRNQHNRPTTFLINTTNLAWFGDTVAQEQHLQMARMRTLETQRPMARATNTGITAAIDAQGKVLARLPTFMTGELEITIQPMSGFTPYIKWGNLPFLLTTLIVLAIALISNDLFRKSR